MMNFIEIVSPCLLQTNKVSLSNEEVTIISNFTKKIVSAKMNESHHKIDGSNEQKRWMTGIGGEIALGKFINKPFVDLSIGQSNDYFSPDLKSIGLNVGVKTVEFGKFPIIFKKSFKPEIIVVKKNDFDFYICGLASVDILNKFQSESLILSPALRARGTKTGFYGFQHLLKFNTLNELIQLNS
jgi:hypothetical protein